MTATCRTATATDVATLHDLLTQMAAEFGRTIAATPASLHRHGFGPNPRYRAVLAEASGHAEGLAIFYPEFSSWRGQAGLYIQDLYVRPQARGRGLASALLAAALHAAADWQPAYVTLMVDQRNDAAQNWYAKQGFTLRDRGDLMILQGPALHNLTQGATP